MSESAAHTHAHAHAHEPTRCARRFCVPVTAATPMKARVPGAAQRQPVLTATRIAGITVTCARTGLERRRRCRRQCRRRCRRNASWSSSRSRSATTGAPTRSLAAITTTVMPTKRHGCNARGSTGAGASPAVSFAAPRIVGPRTATARRGARWRFRQVTAGIKTLHGRLAPSTSTSLAMLPVCGDNASGTSRDTSGRSARLVATSATPRAIRKTGPDVTANARRSARTRYRQAGASIRMPTRRPATTSSTRRLPRTGTSSANGIAAKVCVVPSRVVPSVSARRSRGGQSASRACRVCRSRRRRPPRRRRCRRNASWSYLIG